MKMFDTSEPAPIPQRLASMAKDMIQAEGRWFPFATRDQAISALLCAAHGLMEDGDDKRLLGAQIDIHKAELDERTDEDALYDLDEAATAVHVRHSEMCEGGACEHRSPLTRALGAVRDLSDSDRRTFEFKLNALGAYPNGGATS
jgi:hypothetical protein